MRDEVEKSFAKQDEKVEEELHQASHWREKGNEGRARVCARRAAGWAVGNYRRRSSHTDVDDDAYKQLIWLRDQVDADRQLTEAADRLCTKVCEDFKLPHHEDPLEDARVIIDGLRTLPARGETQA
jgi:hypothetical protein